MQAISISPIATPAAASRSDFSSRPNRPRGKSSNNHHIWLVTGPAGCGKSTLAQHLSSVLGIPYLEGDKFHSQTNVDKMTRGIPLNDTDRWDWLTTLRDESLRHIHNGAPGVIVTCSALKRKYRDVIRVAAYFDLSVRIHFFYLHAPQDLVLERVRARQNHYMGANMVRSQFDILERPAPSETDVETIDVTQPLDVVKEMVLATVREGLDREYSPPVLCHPLLRLLPASVAALSVIFMLFHSVMVWL